MTLLGSALYQKLVNKYILSVDPENKRSRLLYPGEYHIPLHNFSGPGTRMDLKEVRDFPPYNNIDDCSKTHDHGYEQIKHIPPEQISKEDRADLIKEADKEAIECYDKYPNEYGYKLARAGISSKMTAAQMLSKLLGKSSVLYGTSVEQHGGQIPVIYQLDLNKGGNIEYETDSKMQYKISQSLGKLMAQRRELPEVENIDMKKAIKDVSYNKDNISPFGSWIYKSQQYPGDIDLVENEEKIGTKEEVIAKFIRLLKHVVRKILKSKGSKRPYLGDIKAGIDRRYIINIGKLIYDDVGNYKLVGYDPERIKNEVDKLVDVCLLSDKDRNNIMEDVLSIDEETDTNYENLFEKIREKWLLRWSGEEILAGYKILPKNLKYTLEEAITDPVLTKIDIWENINERFIEISNVFTFYYVDDTYDKNAVYADNKDITKGRNNVKVLNYENNLSNLANSLKYEVQKYAFSKKYFKPVKMIKRMWSIARLMKDYKTIELLTTIMQSDIGRLSQLNSDIEVLILMLNADNIKILPKKSMIREIDNFKFRLSNVYSIKMNYDALYSEINDIISLFNSKTMNHDNRKLIATKLKDIKKYLLEFINYYALDELKKIGYYPPPEKFLPNINEPI